MKMTDKKYTNGDIISSLKVIATTRNCNECKIRNCKWGTCNCEQITANAALELINRQKSEIERLRAKVETRTQEKLALGRVYTQKLKNAEAEAYKEFADMIMRKIVEVCNFDNGICARTLILTESIDNLLKEMIGEENV